MADNMADNADQPRSSADPDQEEYFNPDDADADSDTSSGRRAAQRVEDSIVRAMEWEIAKRDKQFRGPEKAYEIPAELYQKAEKHNAHLTDAERALLLSRGDVVGKALAHPEQLTLEERYQALMWSPPGVLHAAIRDATGGEWGTPEELYKLAREAGGELARLSAEAKRIVQGMFWVDWESATLWPRMYWMETPGNGQAMGLLYRRAGMDPMWLVLAKHALNNGFAVPVAGPALDAAVDDEEGSSGTQRPVNTQEAVAVFQRSPPVVFTGSKSYLNARLAAMREYDEDGPPKKRTALQPSRSTAGSWPAGCPPPLVEPSRLFWHEVMREDAEFKGRYFEDVKAQVEKRWGALSAAEQAVSVAQGEALRQQAWDEVDERTARWERGEAEMPGEGLKLPGLDEFLEWQNRDIMERAGCSGPPPEWSRNSRDSE